MKAARRAARPIAAPPADPARTLAFLADLSQAFAVSLDLRKTLPEAIKRVADFMHAEGASLFLLDPATHVLECRICVGPVDMTGVRLAIGQGVVGLAVAENATQIVTDAANDPRVWRAGDEASGFVTKSILCAPLGTAAGPIGVIELVNRRDGRPFDREDAEMLRLIAAPSSLAINNARMANDLVEQQRMKREFDLARKLQKSLLPKRRRGLFPVLGVNLPAHEISGDFYDYFELADGRIGFVIGDISGKGLDAALLMIRAASLLRWAGKDGIAPGAWLARANDELCETTHDGRFVCALVGYCDRAANSVQLAAAGFPPALVYRRGTFTEYPSGGPPLGIMAGIAFEQQDIALNGGALYAFSDGATDVRGAGGKRLGNDGVRDLIKRHATKAPDARLRALLSDLKHLKLVDDTTLLLIEKPRAHDAQVLLEHHMPAQAEFLRDMRNALRKLLDQLGIEPALRDRLVLAVDEACTNIIRHAYGSEREGGIGLLVTRVDDVLSFELTDDAPCVDPGRMRPKPLGECRAGGLGIALIDTVMDTWHVEPASAKSGNRLVLRKRIEDKGFT
ncbi:MAG: SpoIIE family protein phosphatase [Rhodanobacteraceae bacterium]